jgi:hypothetical protein
VVYTSAGKAGQTALRSSYAGQMQGYEVAANGCCCTHVIHIALPLPQLHLVYVGLLQQLEVG